MVKSTRNRRASWGSLKYDSKTRTARIRYWAEGPDGYRRRSKTYRDVTRKEAEQKRALLLLEHGDDAPCPTVGQVWERYVMPDMRKRIEDGDLSSNTLKQYKRWWAKHVKPTWKDVPCDQVRPLAVQQWISTLGLSPARNAMPMLRKAMDYAVRYEWCQTNPMNEKYLMPSKSTVNQRDKGIWTLQELEPLWKSLYGTWMEPAFLVAAFGGTRVGETLGPMKDDVELREVGGVPIALIRIVRQVEHQGTVATRLKNRQSKRTIAIPGKPAARIAHIASSLEDGWFLTNDGMGHHVRQERYYDNWKKMGFEHPFRNLRNSWQTWMRWEMRVAPYYIEPMMGHAIRGTTGQYYDRPQADVFAEVVAEAYGKNRFDAGWMWLD